MPRFFAEHFDFAHPVITGPDADHIRKSLRMTVGEGLTVCDTMGTDYLCRIADIADGAILLTVEETRPSDSEPKVAVTLFQCLPKGDNLETVIQKSVELGVREIVPVLSSRCISRPDDKSMKKKLERYAKIAASAAKQSGRGVIPAVRPLLSFREMAERLAGFDRALFFYEGGGAPLRQLLTREETSIALIIGPEGGFDAAEAELAVSSGAKAVGLGRRILRTETAPIAALAGVMLLTGNLE